MSLRQDQGREKGLKELHEIRTIGLYLKEGTTCVLFGILFHVMVERSSRELEKVRG